MKVLMITPYVTIEGRPEFERNKTGFGYMVLDIAKAVGKIENVEVLATDTRGESFEFEGVKFLKRSLLLFLLSSFHCLSFGSLFLIRKHYPMSKGALFRLSYYWLMTGYLRKSLKGGKYDIVHIHGCGFALEFWLKLCKQCEQKYIVTLHGLTSFSDAVGLENAGKKYERDFLRRVTEGQVAITVISTGMKRIIENTYNMYNCSNIYVVCNSFSFNKVEVKKKDIRKAYNLPENSKIIINVGNICPRKNQGQLIKAFDLIQNTLKEKTYVLFIGGTPQPDYTIEMFATSSQWKSHFINCGVIHKDEISDYYEQCDAVALMSLSEGFGLSLIEGMHFGKPCITFTDVDAFLDIYHPDVMIGVVEHTNEGVACGLEQLLNNEWDCHVIQAYSKRFESESMANSYKSVYSAIIELS